MSCPIAVAGTSVDARPQLGVKGEGQPLRAHQGVGELFELDGELDAKPLVAQYLDPGLMVRQVLDTSAAEQVHHPQVAPRGTGISSFRLCSAPSMSSSA